jgi:hypothetical protein
MRRFWRSWGFTLFFWVFFIGSIALYDRHAFLDKVWMIAGLGVLAALSTFHLIRVSRHIGRDRSNVSYRGVPDWLREMFGK